MVRGARGSGTVMWNVDEDPHRLTGLYHREVVFGHVGERLRPPCVRPGAPVTALVDLMAEPPLRVEHLMSTVPESRWLAVGPIQEANTVS